MKKIYLFAALSAGIVLTSCSSDDLKVKEDPQVQTAPGAVGFDVYAQKTTTRAGVPGSLTTSKLLDNTSPDAFNEAGFGVFAYYTDNNEYDQRSVPNFMYNQQVNWDGSSWNYSPLVYWPNEYGDQAKSDDSDKLTFFAYAPYVKVIPSSGKVANTATAPADNTKELESYGITGMTRNSNQGDPILKYIASFNADKSVDLCWGVADNNDGINWNITQTGDAQTSPATIENGKPWLDVQRPANTNQKVKFTFKHATAQMQVKIDADVDVDGHGHSNAIAAKTRVWVRQVTFKGFAMKGSLNLNNDDASKAKWLDYNGQNELVAEDVVVYDQRKDGKEGVNGSVATNEKTIGLNPTIVQDGIYQNVNDGKNVYEDTEMKVVGTDGSSIRTGVTNESVNLFANGSLFHVIPVDNEAFEVEIVYDIETVDANLAQNLSDGQTKGSSIENRISKKVTFGSEDCLLAGHSYILTLHLGMNSVKFDAAVTDWIAEPTQDVDLPLNVPAFAAEKPVNEETISLPYIGNYTFAMTGLDGGESVNYAASTTLTGWGCSTPAHANTSGVAIQTITTEVNPNTTDRTHVATWTGAQSSKGVKMTFKQKAHPLFLAIKAFANSGDNGTITLMRRDNAEQGLGETPSHWGATLGWMADKTDGDHAVLKVWRNGTLLDSPTFANASTTGDNYTNVITIGDKLQPGDVIKVELTTGDAPTETVTATVGGIAYSAPSRTVVFREEPYTYNVRPNYSGANSTPSITYVSSKSSVADNPNTDGTLTTKLAGTTVITATLAASGLDLGNTATLNLTVVEQDSKIGDAFADEDISKEAAQLNEGNKLVKSYEGIKAYGTEDSGHALPDAGMSYTIVGVTDGTNAVSPAPFSIGNSKRLYTTTAIAAGTYYITLKATHTGETGKYNGCDKTIVVKLTVTTP